MAGFDKLAAGSLAVAATKNIIRVGIRALLKNEEQRRQERREKRGVTTHRHHRIVRVCVYMYKTRSFSVGRGDFYLDLFLEKKRLRFVCVVFCLGFYKKIQNPKHIYVSKKASLSFLFFVFFSPFVFSFLVGLCIEYARSTRAL